MKKILLSLLILLHASCVWAQKPVKVQINVEGETELSKLYINVGEEGVYGRFKEDEVIEGKKGKFTFSKNINQIVPVLLKRKPGQESNVIETYLVPGEKLNLTIRGNEFFYDGSKIYKEMNDADKFYSPLMENFNSYYDKALAEYQNAPEDKKEEVNKVINDSLEQKYNHMKEAVVSYRKSNIGVEGAVLYLSDVDDVEMIYSDLLVHNDIKNNPDFLKTNRVGAFLNSRVKFIVQRRKMQAEQDSLEQAKLDAMKGAPAKDFTLNDINGQPLSLSSLRGKYVILDFWGSWCGWCIKGIPDMKKYYEKYSDKLQILGIDCNDTEQKWKDAVAKYELPWLHVYNPRNSTVLNDYNITGFPTKIVIDPQGNILKVIIGEDPAFYKFLDSLFEP